MPKIVIHNHLPKQKARDAEPEYNWKVVVSGGTKYSDKPSKKTYTIVATNKESAEDEAAAVFYDEFREEGDVLSAVKGSMV